MAAPFRRPRLRVLSFLTPIKELGRRAILAVHDHVGELNLALNSLWVTKNKKRHIRGNPLKLARELIASCFRDGENSRR